MGGVIGEIAHRHGITIWRGARVKDSEFYPVAFADAVVECFLGVRNMGLDVE